MPISDEQLAIGWWGIFSDGDRYGMPLLVNSLTDNDAHQLLLASLVATLERLGEDDIYPIEVYRIMGTLTQVRQMHFEEEIVFHPDLAYDLQAEVTDDSGRPDLRVVGDE